MLDKKELEERFFANHEFKPEIGLAEYDLASKRLDVEEKTFLWATNIISIFSTALWYFGFNLKFNQSANKINDEVESYILTCFLLFSVVISLMSITHISKLIKNKVFAERKIVLLRRAMGVKYGKNSMVLPSWRIEGSDNPFSIKLFPGFFSYSSFPVYIVLSFSFFGFLF